MRSGFLGGMHVVNFVCVVACRVPVLLEVKTRVRVETRVAASSTSRLLSIMYYCIVSYSY